MAAGSHSWCQLGLHSVTLSKKNKVLMSSLTSQKWSGTMNWGEKEKEKWTCLSSELHIFQDRLSLANLVLHTIRNSWHVKSFEFLGFFFFLPHQMLLGLWLLKTQNLPVQALFSLIEETLFPSERARIFWVVSNVYTKKRKESWNSETNSYLSCAAGSRATLVYT